MLRSTLIAVLCLSVGVSVARAYDWSARASLSETVELNDNRLMRNPPLGYSANSTSSLLFDAHALTPTSRFDLAGGLTYRAYSGPGEVNTLNALDNNVSARFEKSSKLTTYNFNVSRREAESSTIQLQETGFATLTGSTITTSYGGGFRHDFNPSNSVASQTTLTQTDFTLNNGTPLTSLTSSLSWNHKATPTTLFTPSLQFQHLEFDNAVQSEIKFWRAAIGMTKLLSPVLTFNGEFGGTWLESTQNSPTATTAGATNPGGQPVGSGTDWIANAALTYQLNKSITLSTAASKTVGPTTFGQFLITQSVSASLSYIINSVSSFAVAGSFSQQSSVAASPGSSTTETFSAVATYSRILTRDWRSNLTYRYVQRESNGTVNSNAVIMSLARNVTILP